MTLKEMLLKVESYNEIAATMHGDTVKITVVDGCFNEGFHTWKECRQAIRREFVKEYADAVLKCDAFEFDGEAEITFPCWYEVGGMKTVPVCTFLHSDTFPLWNHRG